MPKPVLNKEKQRSLLGLALNGAIVLSTALAVGSHFSPKNDNPNSRGTRCLRYFTTDSNLLCAASAAAMAVHHAIKLKDPAHALPERVKRFKFTGTAALGVTMGTVMLFLAPGALRKGNKKQAAKLFLGRDFFLHVCNPLLAMSSWLFLERSRTEGRDYLLRAELPSVAYSFVYFTAVVLLQRWPDFYSFTFGGRLYLCPVSMAGIYLLNAGVSAALKGKKAG